MAVLNAKAKEKLSKELEKQRATGVLTDEEKKLAALRALKNKAATSSGVVQEGQSSMDMAIEAIQNPNKLTGSQKKQLKQRAKQGSKFKTASAGKMVRTGDKIKGKEAQLNSDIEGLTNAAKGRKKQLETLLTQGVDKGKYTDFSSVWTGGDYSDGGSWNKPADSKTMKKQGYESISYYDYVMQTPQAQNLSTDSKVAAQQKADGKGKKRGKGVFKRGKRAGAGGNQTTRVNEILDKLSGGDAKKRNKIIKNFKNIAKDDYRQRYGSAVSGARMAEEAFVTPRKKTWEQMVLSGGVDQDYYRKLDVVKYEKGRGKLAEQAGGKAKELESILGTLTKKSEARGANIEDAAVFYEANKERNKYQSAQNTAKQNTTNPHMGNPFTSPQTQPLTQKKKLKGSA